LEQITVLPEIQPKGFYADEISRQTSIPAPATLTALVSAKNCHGRCADCDCLLRRHDGTYFLEKFRIQIVASPQHQTVWHTALGHSQKNMALTTRRVSGFMSGPLRENLCTPF
jgi:hypothetical protein